MSNAENLAAIARSFLADAANQSLVANGYQKFPSGLIIQWGYSQASVAGSAVSFPIAFPNGCLQIAVGQAGSGGTTYIAGTPSASGFTFHNTAGTGSHRWIAVGY